MKDMTSIQVGDALLKGSLAQKIRSGLTLIAPGMDLSVNCADQRRFGATPASIDDVRLMYPRVRG